MAKEFDIYLKRRVTECDLVVFSLPFRDGLTATNRMILESCVDTYQLYKFIAAQTGSTLSSHIDKMIKFCNERLQIDMNIGVSAYFQTHYTIYPTNSIIEISPGEVSTLSNIFTAGVSAMQFGAAPLFAQVARSFGDGNAVVDISSIDIDSRLQDILKQSILRLGSELEIGADVFGTNETSFIAPESSIIPTAGLENLCYLITGAGSTAMEIAALVLGTEIHFSFGRAYSSMSLGSSLQGENIQKYEVIENTLNILASLTEQITYYITPEGTAADIMSSASPIVRRHRLLSEMNPNELEAYEDMTLEDAYFVNL